jgi:hypothetical protein
VRGISKPIDHVANTLADRLGRRNQLLGLGSPDVGATMAASQVEPHVEMPPIDPEWDVFHGHRTGIIDRTAGQV